MITDKMVEAACEAYWNGPKGEDVWSIHQRKDDEREYMRDALEAAERERGDSPDYCFNADDWETTYPWRDRDEIVMDLSPGDSIEVSCLKQLPMRWACCVVRDNEYETLWFDTQEAMEKAIADWRTRAEADA